MAWGSEGENDGSALIMVIRDDTVLLKLWSTFVARCSECHVRACAQFKVSDSISCLEAREMRGFDQARIVGFKNCKLENASPSISIAIYPKLSCARLHCLESSHGLENTIGKLSILLQILINRCEVPLIVGLIVALIHSWMRHRKTSNILKSKRRPHRHTDQCLTQKNRKSFHNRFTRSGLKIPFHPDSLRDLQGSFWTRGA